MNVDYHPSAVTDLGLAADFYESKSLDLGKQLLDEYERTLNRIIASPRQYGFIHEPIRAVSLRRFPYRILYRESGSKIRVLVFRHHSQNPDYGLDRS